MESGGVYFGRTGANLESGEKNRGFGCRNVAEGVYLVGGSELRVNRKEVQWEHHHCVGEEPHHPKHQGDSGHAASRRSTLAASRVHPLLQAAVQPRRRQLSFHGARERDLLIASLSSSRVSRVEEGIKGGASGTGWRFASSGEAVVVVGVEEDKAFAEACGVARQEVEGRRACGGWGLEEQKLKR
ncbi:hypothetical protein LR48_Vigan11g114000 [Vigna angularis]|uniref:Uncharacterized protein n=1 Tax=Phaseolus angularis TaxID=3914 RepID=A0A0L9VSP7_PHAAN|nr:hypothetical protein LR48_Vigan11g114000 [Vigna angularis]